MRNDDIVDLENSLHACESELSDHVAKSKHVSRMAECIEFALVNLQPDDCTPLNAPIYMQLAKQQLQEAMNHFAEWEK